jgi:glycosyltransferase involved in cell wall biosynthesis
VPTDIVIPARNERAGIGDVVCAFTRAAGVGTVYVVDDASADETARAARRAGAVVLAGPGKGKGQAMSAGIERVETERVAFCDADFIGLDPLHVEALISVCGATEWFGMTRVMGRKEAGGRIRNIRSYMEGAGCRCLPTVLVQGVHLHGFVTDRQINDIASAAHVPAEDLFIADLITPAEPGRHRQQWLADAVWYRDVWPTLPDRRLAAERFREWHDRKAQAGQPRASWPRRISEHRAI